MTVSAFASPGRFFRGNIHTHSTRSDGALSPDEVCRIYREADYDFLCLSDHFLEIYDFPIVDTKPYRTPGFTTIIGAEIHAMANSHGELWHLLACGLPHDFAPLRAGEDAIALARRAVAAGAFLGIAHPQWSGLAIEDGRQMALIAHAVEIWNHTSAVETDRGDGASFLDALLNDGHRFLAYACDDAHFKAPDWFGAWMMVKAEENSPENLLGAMKRGDFYSSRGPMIEHIEIDRGIVHITSSAIRAAALLGRGSRAECVEHGTGGDKQTTLPLSRFAGDWCRLVVIDEAGRQAWTNPLWLD
jgi:hypothetical protein